MASYLPRTNQRYTIPVTTDNCDSDDVPQLGIGINQMEETHWKDRKGLLLYILPGGIDGRFD